MFTVKIQDKEITLNSKMKVMDLIDDKNRNYYVCKVNGRLRELTYPIDSDSEVELVDLSNHDGMRVYEASLRFIFIMALKNISPKSDVIFNQFISQSISCEISNYGELIDQKLTEKIEAEMRRIIKSDITFERKTVSTVDALGIFEKFGYVDKKEIAKYRPDSVTHFYQCGDYIDYMFNYMVPSTGYIKDFNLLLYYPLILLQYPRYDLNGGIPNFSDSPKLSRVFRDAERWANICHSQTLSEINQNIENGLANDFINMCESRHANKLADIANQIEENIDTLKIIAVAGPSSSGKTTFTNRLRIELQCRGIEPVMISLDDYYRPKHESPKQPNGKPDLEHIEALDIKHFNENILALIQNETVTLPRYNFKIGKREVGKTVTLKPNSIIMIEGIHALNDRLTPLIPRYQKFKIYITPISQIKIDNHNPISITDVRMLRRLVRDYLHRNTPAADTFAIWSSVRAGEYRWIYPFQEEADVIFNSSLTYEFSIMKKYALPLLNAIPNDNKYFIIANRLIKFLKYVVEIDDKLIPANSLLREFVGGSNYGN